MILKDPWQAGGVRGSLGSVTFSIHRGTITGRTRTRPARRLRTTQPRNRSILGFLSREWGNITAVQRALWENYALNHPETNPFGIEFIMSGINAYVKLNHSAIRMGGKTKLQTEPPTADPIATMQDFVAATGAGNPGEVDLTWTQLGTGVAADYEEVRVAGPFISPGRQEVFERKRFNKSVTGDLLATTVASLVEEQWYWFYARYLDQFGQTTAWMVDQATPKLTP